MFVPRHFALCVYVKWRGIFLASLKMKSSGIPLSQPLCCFCECKKKKKSQWQYFVIVQKAPAFHASLLRPAETERDRCKFWSSVLKRLKVTFLFTFLTIWVLHVSVSVLKCLLLRGQLKKLHL